MLPNHSSSDEISLKINAFVQNNEDPGDVIGVAQPHISLSPSVQVPDKRDKMVVVTGDCKVEDPTLTVITCHPSQAPATIPFAICKSESDGSSMMPGAERQQTGALCYDSTKSSNSINYNISCKVLNNLIDVNTIRSLTLVNIPQTNDDAEFSSFKICDYYSRWGIPRCFKLLGGGESALTGTAGWGTPPTSQSGTTGWTSGSTGQQSTQGSQGGNNSNNNNNRQGQSGSGVGQQAQGGPPSQTQAPATTSAPNSTPVTANTTTSTNSNITSGNPGTPQISQLSSVSQNGTTGPSVGAQTGGANTSGTSWAAATAGKGGIPSSPQVVQPPNQTNSSNSTKQQMEQLNTMREALFSQDGWGGQNVNQDSNWDIPGSPEPGNKDNNNAAAVPMWKLPINNGTDLWEANLRNGGIPPPQNPTQKTAWGHTPSSNIGGTWGEDDEMDSSNFWTGVPPSGSGGVGGSGAGSGGGSAPQWPNQPPQIWPAGSAKKDGDWNGPNWSEQRGDPRDIRHGEMRQMMDARENMRPGNIDNSRSISSSEVIMRGDHRGISGRLNGVPNDPMWPTGPGGPHHHLPHHQTKLPNHPNQPGVNQWSGGNGPPIKEIGLGGKSGWEEPSPPAQRRNMPNYDDGTSLWGSQHTRPAMPGTQNKVSHWKEMPATGIGRGLQCPPGRGNPNMKPDQPIIWPPHHPRNGGWGEGGIDVNAGPWAEEKQAPWMDQSLSQSSWQSGPKHKPSWDGEIDPSSSWVGSHATKAQPSKAISKEMIWGSKQYRILTEMGFKKEDVENALRSSGLVLDDALEQLNAARNEQRWRHSDLDPEHSIMHFPSPQPAMCIPYQTNGGGGSSASGGAGGNVLSNSSPSLATISPAIMQKLLSQQPPPQQQPPFTQQSSRTQQPSSQQLRMLVQQIQMAVQNGYLTPQILSQPLAPQTLLLLNQILQQIKTLQQLMQQATVMQINPLNKPTSNQYLQITVQITKTKQQITNLQNQIAAQQAVYVKHQQQTPQSNELFKSSIHDTMSSGLPSNFSDLSLKDSQVPQSTGQQSRLNQWKLPALDKDSDMGSGNEFSRAPGSTAKPAPGNSSPNINPLLGQPDGTWSSVNRNNCDTGWPDSGGDDNPNKDWPSTTQSQSFSDLVPEFEPGKPWKGNPLKSIEDDPSITPGSVVRPPLSIPPIKDSHILSSSSSQPGKASPTTSSSLEIMPQIPSLSLSSSTWTFNPPVSSTSDMFDSGLGKLTGSKGSGGVSSTGSNSGNGGNSTWGESGGSGSSAQSSSGSELWATPKSRGPPPGLPAKPQSQGNQGSQSQSNSGGAQSSNGWLSSRWGGPQTSWPQPTGGSTWLLLRNLTPQIDGSTLKTLCLQHGPLHNFHLYLNHGIALAKYASREEASKAQGALNNCVLGNTTIFAESPSENDVLSLLQHLGHSTGGQQSGNGGGAWRPTKETWAGGNNSQLWGGNGSGNTSTTASLWGDSSDQHRTTPSSINSFLPGDLLGGESM